MKNVLKTLTGIMLVFAMVVTTGINSNAAGIKTNDGVQAAEQTTEAVLCGNNVRGGVTTHAWELWMGTNTKVSFDNLHAVYGVSNKFRKADWKVSDKKIAKVVKTKNGMQIKTGKKAGSVVLQAKYRTASETVVYKLKIKVVKSTSAYKGKAVKTELVEFDPEYMVVTYVLYNGTNKEHTFSNERELRKYENGKWKKVDAKSITISKGYILPAHSCKYWTFNLADRYDLSKLEKGQYRLYVGYSNKYVSFKII